MLGLYYFPEILRDNIGILQLLPSLSEKIYIYSLIKRFSFFFVTKNLCEIGTESLTTEYQLAKTKRKDAEQNYSAESERLKAPINKIRGTLTWIECRSYCTCSLSFPASQVGYLRTYFFFAFWLVIFLCNLFVGSSISLYDSYRFPLWNKMPCLYGNSVQTFCARIRAFEFVHYFQP